MFEKLRGWQGTTWVIFINSAAFAAIQIMIFTAAVDYQEMVAYAKRHGLEKYLVGTSSDMALIAYDVDRSYLIYHTVMVCATLCGVEIQNLVLLLLVERKLRQSRESMSAESYKMQKMLTLVLVLQAIVPFFSISIPIATYILAFNLQAQFLYESTVFQVCCAVLFGGYPLVDCLLILFLMKPYRIYTRKLLGRILPALAPTEVVLLPSSTSNALS